MGNKWHELPVRFKGGLAREWHEINPDRDFHFRLLGALLGELIENECPCVTDRKVQLFQIAAARRVAPLAQNALLDRTIELADQAIDAPGGFRSVLPLPIYEEIMAECSHHWPDFIRGTDPTTDPCGWPVPEPLSSTLSVAASLAYPEELDDLRRCLGGRADTVARWFTNDQDSTERDAQIRLIHEIFGDPITHIPFLLSWRTDTATTLASQMYESRDFGAMPILADALQDAGCDNEDILSHCRNTKQIHVRGCWVVDLVLGKT